LSFSLSKLIILLSPSEANRTCDDLAAVPANAQQCTEAVVSLHDIG
jgi:hypothetical protein